MPDAILSRAASLAAHQRLPNTLNVSFVDRVGSELLAPLPVLAASTGSACHEDEPGGSSVLAAVGLPPGLVLAAVRLSVGRFTTEREVDQAAALLAGAASARSDADR